jgi:hypothetical protein
MQKLILTSKLLLIIAVVTFGFTACQKNKFTDETDVKGSENLAFHEAADDDAQLAADEAFQNESVENLRTIATNDDAQILGCAIVTKDTVLKKITIDFGTGCTGVNGRVRKGKILVSYTGRYRNAGSIITITSDNYYVDGNKVDIERTVTNNGTNGNGNYTFTIVSHRMVTHTNGNTSESHVNKVREWTEGSTTPGLFSDDVYKVTGTGTHTSQNGILYDVSTLTDLTRKVSCHQFTAGELKIIRHGQRDRTAIINFGNGTCDGTALVTLDNGRTFTINLR